ncbi:hypothetical protein [Streptomyces sp. NPDC050287]|uniref:hypothetical protein n=1 Tax=Streptomyces sp. NPDC050287 TaxID=3365608 RepID=UPI0037B1266D
MSGTTAVWLVAAAQAAQVSARRQVRPLRSRVRASSTGPPHPWRRGCHKQPCTRHWQLRRYAGSASARAWQARCARAADRAEEAVRGEVWAVQEGQTRVGPPARGRSSTVQMRRTAACAPPSLM